MADILITQELLDLLPELTDAGFQLGDPIIITGLTIPAEARNATTSDDDSGFVGTRPGHGRPIAG